MNSFAGWRKSRLLAITLMAATGVLLMPGAVTAQQQMTVEELENYIAEQKAALEAVKSNRDETERKAQEVRETLAEQAERQAMVEEELEALCKEQEELKPGSYEQCRAAFDK